MTNEELQRMNRDINARLAPIFHEMEQASLRRARYAAEQDPDAHKFTRVMAAGKPASYRYYQAGKDVRGSKVRYCYSVHRNAAGYFLGWRETETAKRVVRDMWFARERKRDAIAEARHRRDLFKKRAETPT